MNTLSHLNPSLAKEKRLSCLEGESREEYSPCLGGAYAQHQVANGVNTFSV